MDLGINIALLTILGLIFTLSAGVVILFRAAERSFQRNFLIGMMVVWMPMLVVMFMRVLGFIKTTGGLVGYVGNGVIIGGMVGILTMATYGSSVIFYHRFNYKRVLIFITPAIIVVAANVAVHYLSGVKILYAYTTWGQYVSEVARPIVLIRYATIAVQLAYIIFMISNLIQLVPIYNKYIHDNESNERYNLDWLYNYIRVFSCITIVYTTLAIVQTPFTVILYCVVASVCFGFLVDCAISYKEYKRFDEVKLQWKFTKGWMLVNYPEEEVVESSSDGLSEDFENQLYYWIITTEQYANIEFSISDIVAQFSNVSVVDLIKMFESRGYTFQSYVREIRINKAMALIKESNGDLLYKEVYYKVGFSHYSSFSRAFTAVVGVSPSKYRS